MKAHPGANAIASYEITRSPSAGIMLNWGAHITTAYGMHEHLALDPSRDNLLLLGGWQRGNILIYKSLYPHATVKIYDEPSLHDDAAIGLVDWSFYSEYCYVDTYLVSIFVPQADAARMHGALVSVDGAPEAPMPVFDKDGLKGLAGHRVRMTASIWLDVDGTTIPSRVGLPPLTARLGLPGLQLENGWRACGSGNKRRRRRPEACIGSKWTGGRLPTPAGRCPWTLGENGADAVGQQGLIFPLFVSNIPMPWRPIL